MIEFFLLLTPMCLFAFIMLLGYRKHKRRKNATENVVQEPDDKVMLHGHDLSKWNYLGYTQCKYVDESGKPLSTYSIFLFSSKDEKRRSYYCASSADTHSYVETYVKPWAAGEGEIYSMISGKGNKPSDYLKAYMLEHFSSEWDDETNWWGSSDKAKYTSAQNKQKRERKTKEEKPEVKTENNVVTVEFGKQA